MIDDSKVLETMQKDQEQHYKDDAKNFGGINVTLKDQNKVLDALEAKMDIINTSWKRIEPIVIAHEEQATAFKYGKRLGIALIWVCGAIATISGAWFIIKNWLINLR